MYTGISYLLLRRHSRPLFLNDERYEELRRNVLRHELPSIIARAMLQPMERTESTEFLFEGEEELEISDED